MIILFNGVPSSGKSTLAHKLHFYLEHRSKETVYLDDEVIKRLDNDSTDRIVKICNAEYTIIASCNPYITADVKFWCLLDPETAWRRDCEKLEREHAPIKPKLVQFTKYWSQFRGEGIIIDTSQDIEKCFKEVLCALKLKN